MSDDKAKSKKTTIVENGPSLPIGLVSLGGDSMGRIFQVRPWRMKEEKQLARLAAENPEATVTKYVSMVLSAMCSKMGSADFDNMKEPQRLAVISSMYMADVFYAYIWLRIQAIGPDLSVNLKCPRCKEQFTFVGDLNSTEVNLPVSPEDVFWEYKLVNPIQLRGRLVEAFRMGPQYWYSMESVNAIDDGMKAMTILASIRGIVGDTDTDTKVPLDIALLPEELDEMSKRDIELMTKGIGLNHRFGPDMALDAVCEKPKCAFKWKSSINWRYDNFFDSSSV